MSNPTRPGATGGEGVALNETNRLISSDKVKGTLVYNQAGESLGSVYTLTIDKHSGLVSYAVMSFGGFLGVGQRHHPLPWKALTYDTGLGGYVVDVSRDQLEGAPSYADGEAPWSNPAYGRSVSDYYGLPHGGI